MEQILKSIDWKNVLLDNYRDLLLDENQVMIILMTDLCIRNGEKLVTPDILSLKMSMDDKEIDKLYTGLIKKGFIVIKEDENGHPITSLEHLIQILFDSFLSKYAKNQDSKKNDSKIANIIKVFEDRFGRPLTYIELETIQSWIDEKNKPEFILQALDEALSKKIKNIRYIDKIILERRQREEFNKEGSTTISKDWHKNIEETQRIVNLNWVDNHDDEK